MAEFGGNCLRKPSTPASNIPNILQRKMLDSVVVVFGEGAEVVKER
jgi:hypothetical protein